MLAQFTGLMLRLRDLESRDPDNPSEKDPDVTALLEAGKQFEHWQTQQSALLNEVLGVAVSWDTNLGLAQRDKFLSNLKGYLAHRRTDLRHATLDSRELFPNLESVLEVAIPTL